MFMFAYPRHPCVVYLPTFTKESNHMHVNIPCMDGMGYACSCFFFTSISFSLFTSPLPILLAETVAAIFPTASFQTTKTAQFNATNFRQRDQPRPFRRHGWKGGKCSALQTRAGDNFRAAFVAPGDVVFVHLRWSVVEGSKQATDPCEGRT